VKILTLSNLYPPDVLGGYEVCCSQMVDELRRRGHEVVVLSSVPRGPIGGPDPGHIHRRFHLTDIWSTYCYQQSLPVTANLQQGASHRISAHNVHVLLEELHAFRPDVVFLHMLLGLGAFGLLACLQHLRVPWVWQLGDDVPVKMCRVQDAVIPAFAREFSRQARGHYIAVSRQLVDAIEAHGISLNGPLEIIPNGIPGPFPGLRRGYRPGGTLRLATAAGVLERHVDKGADLAIEAAAHLRDSGCADFRLDIYGQVNDPYFAERIVRHGLEAQVALRGFVPRDELVRRYEAYDLFLFPTRPGEPFGVAPLEAASRECVPVISSVCGLAEWLVHGVHVLKTLRDPRAIARTLAEVARGRIELGPLGRRAAAVVRRSFALESLIVRTEAVLERAASRDRCGAGTADEAYRLAVLAERLSRTLIQRSFAA
jgi:glycosyltransferase involved in cell wall biosynthesis